MATVGLRAFGTKGLGWLRLNPWAPLSAGFCSRGAGPRPTSARQRDGIRSAAGSPGAQALPDRPPGGGGRQGPGRRDGQSLHAEANEGSAWGQLRPLGSPVSPSRPSLADDGPEGTRGRDVSRSPLPGHGSIWDPSGHTVEFQVRQPPEVPALKLPKPPGQRSPVFHGR